MQSSIIKLNTQTIFIGIVSPWLCFSVLNPLVTSLSVFKNSLCPVFFFPLLFCMAGLRLSFFLPLRDLFLLKIGPFFCRSRRTVLTPPCCSCLFFVTPYPFLLMIFLPLFINPLRLPKRHHNDYFFPACHLAFIWLWYPPIPRLCHPVFSKIHPIWKNRCLSHLLWWIASPIPGLSPNCFLWFP